MTIVESRKRARHPRAALGLLLATLAVSMLGGCAAQTDEQAADVVVETIPGGYERAVLLVRHAEKQADGGKDPALTDLGQARAERLAEIAAAWQVTHLFSSEFVRTRSTVAPLSDLTGVENVVVSAFEQPTLIENLSALENGTFAVVAGHSNTIASIARDLGGQPSMEEISEDEYDLVLLVGYRETNDNPDVLELTYQQISQLSGDARAASGQ